MQQVVRQPGQLSVASERRPCRCCCTHFSSTSSRSGSKNSAGSSFSWKAISTEQFCTFLEVTSAPPTPTPPSGEGKVAISSYEVAAYVTPNKRCHKGGCRANAGLEGLHINLQRQSLHRPAYLPSSIHAPMIFQYEVLPAHLLKGRSSAQDLFLFLQINYNLSFAVARATLGLKGCTCSCSLSEPSSSSSASLPCRPDTGSASCMVCLPLGALAIRSSKFWQQKVVVQQTAGARCCCSLSTV